MSDEASSKETSWTLAAAVGLGLVAAQVVLVRATVGLDHETARSFSAVIPLILWLAVPAAVLLLAGPRLVRIEEPGRTGWVILIGCGLAMRLAWLGTVPPLEDDYFRYLWDGAVVVRGLDPYGVAPHAVAGGSAPAAYLKIAALPGAAEVLKGINFPELRTIYPSVSQAAFAAAHVIAPFQVDGLRLVFLGAELATLALLIAVLREAGASPLWAALYWWNPLPAALLVGLAHVDALIPPLVLGAVLLATRGRALTAGSLVVLAAGVKIWPLLLVPTMLWPLRRDPLRLVMAALVLGAVLLAAAGPVVLSAAKPGSGLTAYAEGWSNNNGFYAWTVYALAQVSGSWEVAGTMVRAASALAGGAIAIAMAVRGDRSAASLCGRALVVAAATFYLSPAQFPWYAAWFLPLAAAAGSRPLLLASATLPAYYLFFPLWQSGQGALFIYGTAFLHSVPVLLWLVYARGRHGPGGCPAGAPSELAANARRP